MEISAKTGLLRNGAAVPFFEEGLRVEKLYSAIDKHWKYLFVLIPVTLTLVFFYLPLVQGVYWSFTDWSGIAIHYNFVGFDNFARIFSDVRVIASMRFTGIFTASLLIGSIVVAMFLAIQLNQKIRGIGFFRTAYFFPAVVGTATLGMIFRWIFHHGLPRFGRALDIEWLSANLTASVSTAPWAVVFVALWQILAFPTLIILAGLQAIPQEIKEASAIDGANRWQMFKKIELPYLQTAISIIVIFSLRIGLTAFDLVYTMTAGGPAGSTTSLGLLIFNYAFHFNQFGYSTSIAVMVFVLVAIISIIQITLSRKFEA